MKECSSPLGSLAAHASSSIRHFLLLDYLLRYALRAIFHSTSERNANFSSTELYGAWSCMVVVVMSHPRACVCVGGAASNGLHSNKWYWKYLFTLKVFNVPYTLVGILQFHTKGWRLALWASSAQMGSSSDSDADSSSDNVLSTFLLQYITWRATFDNKRNDGPNTLLHLSCSVWLY
jgi:hypothetical protein